MGYARSALTAVLATLIGLAFWIGVIGFLSAEAVETVRERLDLPEKPKVEVEYTGICKTAGTLVCKAYRERRKG